MNVRVLRNIFSGWKNFIWESKDHKELTKVRATICAKCPHADPDYKFKRFIPATLTEKEKLFEIRNLGCTECGCLISAKVRAVKESCPLNKW